MEGEGGLFSRFSLWLWATTKERLLTFFRKKSASLEKILAMPMTMHVPSLTLTQFCALLRTVLFCAAYETLPQRLHDSLGCQDCCTNTNLLNLLRSVTLVAY